MRTIIPIKTEKASGAVENAIIPSREYLKSFQKFQVVVPAARSVFSTGIYFVSKPTQEKIPFEKRLRSLIERIASTICLVIKRKSCAPSTICVWEMLFMTL